MSAANLEGAIQGVWDSHHKPDLSSDRHSEQRSVLRPKDWDATLADSHRYANARILIHEILDKFDADVQHVDALDAQLASAVQCHLDNQQDTALEYEGNNRQDTVHNAAKLLQRLPKTALEVDIRLDRHQTSAGWTDDFLKRSPQSRSQLRMSDLKVFYHIDTNVIRLALVLISVSPGNRDVARDARGWIGSMAIMMNILFDILDDVHRSEDIARDRAMYVLLTMLWVSWQRSIMLYLHYILRTQHFLGYQREFSEMIAVIYPNILSHPSLRGRGTSPNWTKSEYMCNWAYELILASRASVSMDLRVFHTRFYDVVGHRHGRCNMSGTSCNGNSPASCGRFQDKRLVAADQSHHTDDCRDQIICRTIPWDQHSYKSVKGARAIDIHKSTDKLYYRQATGRDDVLAISHVWSHGEGGRPDRGINECLHRRNCNLAEGEGCNAYWNDTTCIPDEHELRAEAIKRINPTFEKSKVTIIIDKDLMSMEIPSKERGIESYEQLLAVLLVCDWELRAWTLLEAVRGNHNLKILCKHDKTISVHDLIKTIMWEGDISLSVLSLASQHLLAPAMKRDLLKIGSISIEEAAAVLAHRYATREGDDVVIWSLLCSEGTMFDSAALWKSRRGGKLNTGFLMSSTPRIAEPNFSWAPAAPSERNRWQDYDKTSLENSKNRLDETYSIQHFDSFEGHGSATATITSHGLEGWWLCHKINDEDRLKYQRIQETSDLGSSKKRSSLTAWSQVEEAAKVAKHTSLMVPRSLTSKTNRYVGAEDKRREQNQFVAICTSDEDPSKASENSLERWKWHSVITWHKSVDLPAFEPKEIVII